MLNKQNIQAFERKKSELKGIEGDIAGAAAKAAGAAASEAASKTAGEIARDATIKAATEAAYTIGNQTNTIVETAEKIGETIDKTGNIVQGGTALVAGSESSAALGNIAFKTVKDVARGDKVCTGLCLVSATCETVALGCSTIKVIPFRGRIYVGAKIISKGCMTYRNACAGEGC